MSYHIHQGCTYWLPTDPDLLKEMEAKREEERERLEEERTFRTGNYSLHEKKYMGPLVAHRTFDS